MKTQTTLGEMLEGNKIFVPPYQRAYSWDTELEKNKPPKHVNTFLVDLNDYHNGSPKSPYYFGHFLFEQQNDNADVFGVIDGQQRLTTLVIFLAALFQRLKNICKSAGDKHTRPEDTITYRSIYNFSTVYGDDHVLRDYVIDRTRTQRTGLDTKSQNRIIDAFEHFQEMLQDKDIYYISKMLDTLNRSSCTTHVITNRSQAIQMFIFQNNRGKKPSNLEIIKAHFMYSIHLNGGNEKESLLDHLQSRFERIYRSISSIEDFIDEDEVLVHTLRVHFNSLWESNAIERTTKSLASDQPIDFIKSFTRSLADSFDYLKEFYCTDQREHLSIHSIISLGRISAAIPFIIKSYMAEIPKSDLCTLCSSLESLIVRQRLIKTRAIITSRLDDVYKRFEPGKSGIFPIIDRVQQLRNDTRWWWAFWNNDALAEAMKGGVNSSLAKFMLWKYENHLLESRYHTGYPEIRFDDIVNTELEHIAPKTENPKTGYDTYDPDFLDKYIECFGNYLLISKSHNSSVGNKPFAKKWESYDYLEQQREVQRMTEENMKWTKNQIATRQRKILEFIRQNF